MREGTRPAVTRKEDHRLLTGRGRFVSDLQLPRMAHVAFVRSIVAHARITGIDTTEAEALPGVRRVFTADSPALMGLGLRAKSALPRYVETEQPALARGVVRFVGEAVAAVVADDRYLAEDGAELVVVDDEPLGVSIRAWDPPAAPLHHQAPDNVLVHRVFERGDPETILSQAHTVVRRSLITNRHAGNPLECRATVALWDDHDHLTLWSGTQIPHLVRNILAELLGVSESNVRVIAPDVGGGFGVKAVLYPEDLAICAMARTMVGTPLKWVEDRVEHLHAATHARDHRYDVTAGFAEDGELVALDVDAWCNVGAYSVSPWTAGIEPLMAGGLFTGPYRLDHYRCEVRGVATNTSPSGPYRGVARPATVFAMEAILDSGARALGMSGAEIRRRNLIRPTDIPYRMPTGLVDDSGHYLECLEQALDIIGYDALVAEQARRRAANDKPLGIGFAVYNELTGLGRAASAGPRMPFRTGHEACTVRVNPDGKLVVLSGVTSQGQGLETTLAQVVADAVGVGYDHVEVRYGDTNESLWGFGAFSSRQAVIAGGAASTAAVAVRDQILELAADLYEANRDDLRLSDGRIMVVGSPQPIGSLADLARVAYLESNRLPKGHSPGLEATRFYDPVLGAFAGGAQVAAVEVDTATGELTVLDWVCVEDSGRVINAQIVEGQVMGSLAQGLGGALYEHLVYDRDGNLVTGTLLDYLMPSGAETPEFRLGHLEHPADNPLGVRGVGEGGTLGPAAVLAGAVADAIGLEIDRLPITPSRLWVLLHEGNR
ncbi:MAG: xanthine dehydrogenase family protein molybdopterin-binding subunit [Actinomycetota bacterium]|nr:xanthine dehydrogenase family protein molybdopterin-binding subunit [Actinomycetota bacterium]